MMELNLLKKFIEVGINKGKEQYTILINCIVKYVMTVYNFFLYNKKMLIKKYERMIYYENRKYIK